MTEETGGAGSSGGGGGLLCAFETQDTWMGLLVGQGPQPERACWEVTLRSWEAAGGETGDRRSLGDGGGGPAEATWTHVRGWRKRGQTGCPAVTVGLSVPSLVSEFLFGLSPPRRRSEQVCGAV